MGDSARNIHILSEQLINKIAAGEVIDRPASVLKELVENSIDAGATRITILVKGGGSALIQVIDDGSGMGEDDAILSLQRHATSKIRTYGDIENILTLGFRGEALASIAAVSRLELKTILQGQVEGTAIQVEGGLVQRSGRTGGVPGTSVAVKNLFFNTPARRKFLRTESTEYRYLLGMLNHFTLAFPEIDFQLINEEKEVFHLAPAALIERIGDVLSSRIRHNLVPIKEMNAQMEITGYIGNYDIMRKSRNDQYLFLNRRFINDRTIAYAVTSAFGESLPKGLYPLFLLFMQIDPDRVDVNVHPTKNEIKFAEPRMVYDLVRYAVKRALKTDDIIPEIKQLYPPHRPFIETFPHQRGDEDRETAQGAFDLTVSPPAGSLLVPPGGEPAEGTLQPATAPSTAAGAANVWQMGRKYILAQIKSGLVVIDQHVAHERILYERAKKNFVRQQGASQQLLFPQTIELSSADHAYLQQILPLLEKIGFVIKIFGGRTVVVEGVPAGVRIGGEDKILLEILDEYKENLESEVNLQERVAKSFACRSAIMAGEKLSPESMNALIDQLFAAENPYFCPHGRPVMVTISVDEIDRRFDRK